MEELLANSRFHDLKMIRAGTPTAMALSGAFCSTTALALFSPIIPVNISLAFFFFVMLRIQNHNSFCKKGLRVSI